jgi:hypothetical protein
MDNLQIEKISELSRNDSPINSGDDLIVNREVSPGVYKTRRGNYAGIFSSLISGVATALSNAATALGLANTAISDAATAQSDANTALGWIASPISSDPNNSATLGTDAKIYVPPVTATTFDRQSDFQNPYQYCGFAPSGSGINDPVWFITRLTVNLNGTELTQTASNVAWYK